MTQRTIDAIFSNGVLRPVEPIDWLEENRTVKVTVIGEDAGGSLAGWVGGASPEDADAMTRAINEGFE